MTSVRMSLIAVIAALTIGVISACSPGGGSSAEPTTVANPTTPAESAMPSESASPYVSP
jgi:hypothetical protein